MDGVFLVYLMIMSQTYFYSYFKSLGLEALSACGLCFSIGTGSIGLETCSSPSREDFLPPPRLLEIQGYTKIILFRQFLLRVPNRAQNTTPGH